MYCGELPRIPSIVNGPGRLHRYAAGCFAQLDSIVGDLMIAWYCLKKTALHVKTKYAGALMHVVGKVLVTWFDLHAA